MIVSRLRKNQILLNKVDGQLYIVKDVWTDQSGNKAGNLVPQNNDENSNSSIETQKIRVTSSNDIIFSIFQDTEPDVPEGFRVENGLLYCGDSSEPFVEQGQLYINEILATVPGVLILTAKCKEEKEGICDVFTFNPEKNVFYKVFREVPESIAVYGIRGSAALLGFNETEVIEVMDEKTKEQTKKVKFIRSKMAFVDRNSTAKTTFNQPMLFEDIHIFDGATLVGCENEVDDNGIVTKSKDYSYYLIEEGFEDEYDLNCYLMPSKPVIVEGGCNFAVEPCMRFTFIGDNFILNTTGRTSLIKTDLAKDFIDYPILVDVIYKDHATILAYANSEFKVKKLQIESTKDRGEIYSIV